MLPALVACLFVASSIGQLALAEWAVAHRGEIRANRRRYDAIQRRDA